MRQLLRQSSLLLLVCPPLAALNADPAIVWGAPPPAREFAPLPVEEKTRLRTQGQAEFYAGDYEKMAQTYSRLLLAEDAGVGDGRWLGHAFQLQSQWKEAASVYTAVIDRMDQLLDRIADEDATETRDPGWPSGNKNELQERAATILLTARIQRYYLKDPAAAEKTLRRIYRGNDVFNEQLDDIARAWRNRIAQALAAEKDAQFAGLDIQKSLSLRFPLMALHELATVQQLNENYADAFRTWQRIHWTTPISATSWTSTSSIRVATGCFSAALKTDASGRRRGRSKFRSPAGRRAMCNC